MKIVTETLVDGALGASGVVAWRWDLQDRRIDWTATAEEVIGLPDIVLRSPDLLMRAIHPDDLPLVSSAYGEALRSGTQLDARFRVIGSSGVRWLDCSGRPIVDESGKVVAATGTVIDVTEECEAEAAMLETLHDTQLVLGEIGARIWEWDADLDVVQYLSPPTGPPILAQAETEGVTLSAALHRLSDQDAALVREKLTHALMTGESISYEVSVLDDNGEPHRVFVRGGVSADSPRRLTGVSIVLN